MHIIRKRQSDSQTALEAQSSAQEAKPTRRTFEAYSLQRIALACLGVLGTGGLLLLAGCPANLEDPQRFDIMGTNGGTSAGGAGPSGGGSAGAAPTVVPAPACALAIFTPTCTMCHVAGNALSAGLDLSGADVANRLVNVTATHMLANPSTSCASEAAVKLIDPSNASASWLLAKVNGSQGMCGLQMPFGMTPLTTDQIACITGFVMSEAPGGAAPAGAAGATATGTGGAAAGGAAATGAGSGGM